MAREPRRFRHRSVPLTSGAVAAAVVAALVPGGAASAAPSPSPFPAPAPQARQAGDGPSRTVTLVTGDRVTVTPKKNAKPGVVVTPGPGRRTGYSVTVTKDKITVLPVDAAGLVAAGRLDRRLFEVDRLLASGYDDASRAALPLIVKRPTAALKAGAQRVRSAGPLTALEAPKSDVGRTWKAFVADGSARMWLDGKVKAALDKSVPQIGAPAAWEKGLTGKGVKVAVLDTGVDADHPDLKDNLTESRNFTTAPSAGDVFGHGTHVASILAGTGAASDGRYRGVAPDASVVSGKVIGDDGEGQESWLIDGMTWAAREAKAKVVNLSMTCFCDSPAVDPVEQALNDLSAETGTLFIGAAGDLVWPIPGLVALPGAAAEALAVSSVDAQDRPAVSTQGPRPWDYAVKPEIMAPGVGIVAARASGSNIGSPVDDRYTRLSGTSAAAPHVAGAAAILAQQHPGWDGRRIKSTLMASAKELDGVSMHVQGAGRVDVAKAVAQRVSASPATVNADAKWPDSGSAPVEQKITYANAGDAPVTLDLAVALADARGTPIPAGAARLDRAQVTVPANGTAAVTLTLGGTTGVTAGLYSGKITASSGGAPAVRTLVNAYVEPPTANVTLPTYGRDGEPSDLFPFISLQRLDTGERFDVQTTPDSVGHARVPPGRYLLSAHLRTGTAWDSGIKEIVEFTAGANRHVLDARQTTPVDFANDTSGATFSKAQAIVGYESDRIATYDFHYADPGVRMSLKPVREPGMTYSVSSLWESKSAQVFRDHRFAVGEVPADPSLRTRKAQMAQVRTTVRSQGTGSTGTIRWGGVPALSDVHTITLGVERAFPSTFTLFLRADPKIAWSGELDTPGDAPDHGATVYRTPRSYRAGPQADVWNAAVLGPNLIAGNNVRDGDRLSVTSACAVTGALDDCGYDDTTEGTLTLSRDGTQIAAQQIRPGWQAAWMDATVPADAATYTLHEKLTRTGPPASVATATDTLWTFRSARTTARQALPLMTVDLLPAGLDDHNRAARSRTTVVPFWVKRNPGAPASAVASSTIEASFDDGKTWRKLRVTGTAGAGAVTVTPPAGAEHVSLRASATDRNGNAVVQTVIRAYTLA
ncbi:S8 family serine peptidase [Actinomadura hibisca]|uniref:S8 family serine peptidase n=1 Tax=Actinomadura hibisca TaxID=68565 RepID=UPI000835CB6D|nr:S8 family serine peptidase [Actinomadura hibisca]